MVWGQGKSKERAKERLKLVLEYDRAHLPPGLADALKADLLEVLKRYFPAREEGLSITLEERGGRVVLIADIPLR
ncbi:MAG: cell division topological specificity factor MinE [Thermaceae bacterium]